MTQDILCTVKIPTCACSWCVKAIAITTFPFLPLLHADSGIASRDMALRLSQVWKSRVIYFTKNYSRLYSRAVSCLYFLGMLNRLFLSFLTGKPQKAAQFGRAIKYYFNHGYKK
ncbi:MAG: hypothetical protein U5N58_02080 [Actinomycetota bacterium]|nr:hypothetical protein [Actinomycetota bacterium]